MRRTPQGQRSLGYILSVISVLLLGAVAWPHARQEWWSLAALMGGVATSMAGIVLRALAHAREARALAEIKDRVNGC